MYIYVCIGELNHDWFGKWPLIIKLRLHRLYPVPTMRCTTPTVFYCRIGEINSLKKLITNTIVIVEKCILKCHRRYLHQFDCPSKNRLRKIAHMVSASISWMIKLPRDMINNCIWYMFDKTSGYIRIVNWITRNKLQRNFNQCAMVFNEEIVLEKSSAKSRPYCHCLNGLNDKIAEGYDKTTGFDSYLIKTPGILHA